jgi:putative transposase
MLPSVSDVRDGVSPSVSGPQPAGLFAVRDTRTLPSRKRPAHGVFVSISHPTIVFLTVCAKDKQRWLAQSAVQAALIDVWTAADAWRVGFYLLMPDHLHLFCAPHQLQFTLDQWVNRWKRKFSCLHLPQTGAWQRGYWDTRLRRAENYSEKWEYVRLNPVRQGLVVEPEDWPYQGVLNELRW